MDGFKNVPVRDDIHTQAKLASMREGRPLYVFVGEVLERHFGKSGVDGKLLVNNHTRCHVGGVGEEVEG